MHISTVYVCIFIHASIDALTMLSADVEICRPWDAPRTRKADGAAPPRKTKSPSHTSFLANSAHGQSGAIRVSYKTSGACEESDSDADVVVEDEQEFELVGSSAVDGTLPALQLPYPPVVQYVTPAVTDLARGKSPPKTKKQTPQLSSAQMVQKKPVKPLSVAERVQGLVRDGVRVLVLMRGAPGSGKSYLATQLTRQTMGSKSDPSQHVFSTDDFFLLLGRFVPHMLTEAHSWNRERVASAATRFWSPIFVDNTNTEVWEMKPYAEIAVKNGYVLELLEPSTPWRYKEDQLQKKNVHRVPRSQIANMLVRFERNLTGKKLLAKLGYKYAAGCKPPQPAANSPPQQQQQQQQQPKVKTKRVRQRRKAKQAQANRLMDSLSLFLAKKTLEEGRGLDPDVANCRLNSGITISDALLEDAPAESSSAEDSNGGEGEGCEDSSSEEEEAKEEEAAPQCWEYILVTEDSQWVYQKHHPDEEGLLIDLTDAQPEQQQNPAPSAPARTFTLEEIDEWLCGDIKPGVPIETGTEAATWMESGGVSLIQDISSRVSLPQPTEEVVPVCSNGVLLPQSTDEVEKARNREMPLSQATDSEMLLFHTVEETVEVSETTGEEVQGAGCGVELKEDSPLTELLTAEDEVYHSAVSSEAEPDSNKEPNTSVGTQPDSSAKGTGTLSVAMNKEPESSDKASNVSDKGTGIFCMDRTASDNNPISLDKEPDLSDTVNIEADKDTATFCTYRTLSDIESITVNKEPDSSHVMNSVADKGTGTFCMYPATSNIESIAMNKEPESSDTANYVSDKGSGMFCMYPVSDIESVAMNKAPDSSVAASNVSAKDNGTFCMGPVTSDNDPVSLDKRPIVPCASDTCKELGMLSTPDACDLKDLLGLASAPTYDLMSWVLKCRDEKEGESSWAQGAAPAPEQCGVREQRSPRQGYRRPQQPSEVLVPSRETEVLPPELQAWGTVPEAAQSWEAKREEPGVPAPAGGSTEEPQPQRSMFAGAPTLLTPDNFVQMSRRSVAIGTEEADFSAMLQSEPAAGVRVVMARNRSICEGVMPLSVLDRPIPGTLMLDKSSMTEEDDDLAAAMLVSAQEKRREFSQLAAMFSTVPEEDLRELFDKCHGNLHWAIDLLLESKLEQFPATEPTPTAVPTSMPTSVPTSITEPMPTSVPIPSTVPTEPIPIVVPTSTTELIPTVELTEQTEIPADPQHLRRFMEDCSANSPKHEPPQEIGDVEEVESISSAEDEEMLQVALDPAFVSQLHERFGNPALPCPEDMEPVVNLPLSLARQIHYYLVESQLALLEQQYKQMEQMIREDEELARQLQAQEQGAAAVVPDMQEIMDMEMALALYHTDQAQWRGDETKEDLATKLSKQRLFEMFPMLERDVLLEVYAAHGHSFDRTVEEVTASVAGTPHEQGVRTVMTPEARAAYGRALMEQARQESSKDCAPTQLPIVVVQDPSDCRAASPHSQAMNDANHYRAEASRHYQLRNECFHKAQDAYRKGLTSVASYYSQVAALHRQRIDDANAKAAASLLQAHTLARDNSTTLDLHYLHVAEALQALDLFLDHHIANLVEQRGRQCLFLITGRGLRSSDGKSRIRPAVERRLKQRGLRWQTVNPGLLKVVVMWLTPLSSGVRGGS
ncbi:NEDD4-binding protein 2-like isoform X2 [Periplaneta americana]|uniref:NEDD4-binding protein 2-like isoform X2 n=1 Tax=Periplaneta americana TaxID=6978 RepID=UPI0037E922D5